MSSISRGAGERTDWVQTGCAVTITLAGSILVYTYFQGMSAGQFLGALIREPFMAMGAFTAAVGLFGTVMCLIVRPYRFKKPSYVSTLVVVMIHVLLTGAYYGDSRPGWSSGIYVILAMGLPIFYADLRIMSRCILGR